MSAIAEAGPVAGGGQAGEKEARLRQLADPWWRLTNLYWIVDENGREMRFVPNEEQEQQYRRLGYRNLILKARQLGFCVSPETRVLTADLRWVPVRDLEIGAEIVAVDEGPPGGKGQARRMRTAVVQGKAVMMAERFRITFDDGRAVECTDRHPWLSRKVSTQCEWRSLSGDGNAVTGRLAVGTQVRWVCKPWSDAESAEHGWFGGMLDGEGSIANARSSAGVNVSQRAGPVWDRLVEYAGRHGYHACVENDLAQRPSKHGRVPVPKLAFGRMDELFRLIGQTRPTRFIGQRWWEGRELPGKRNGDVGWATIVSIEPIGAGPVVDLQTSTGTYIAEGFVSHNTTMLAIMALDQCLFVSNFTAVIIAHSLVDAEKIFRTKIKFAYDHLDPELREQLPVRKETSTEMVFRNGSGIAVATSSRSGTVQWLHVSEFGKMCARFPEKAREVVTGSFNSAPSDALVFIESTAEGQEGYFYDYCMDALRQQEEGRKPARGEWKLHFYPWWKKGAYRNDDDRIAIDTEAQRYFEKLTAEHGIVLHEDQKRWYVVKAREMGDDMKREYPSFPREAFEQAVVGAIYGSQMARLRQMGRIASVPHDPSLVTNTFWDLGVNDVTAIWLHQHVAKEHRFIGYYQAANEGMGHFVKWLNEHPFMNWGVHYLPHDGDTRLQGEHPETRRQILERLGMRNIQIVPRIADIGTGLDLTRTKMMEAWFDQVNCAEGIRHLDNYRYEWDDKAGTFRRTPAHSSASNGADAFRQWAQGYMAPTPTKGFRRFRSSWRS